MAGPNLNQDVGATIRFLRERCGMTRIDLAKKAGFGHSQMEKLERGIRGTTSVRYKRIADALDVPVGELFSPASAAASVSRRASRRNRSQSVHASTVSRAASPRTS